MPTSAKLMPIPSPPLAYRQWFYSQTKSTIRPVSKSKTYENSWRRFTRKRKTTNQHRSNHNHSLEKPLKGHSYLPRIPCSSPFVYSRGDPCGHPTHLLTLPLAHSPPAHPAPPQAEHFGSNFG